MTTENNDQAVVEVEAKIESVESKDAKKSNADRKDSQRGGDYQRRGRNNYRGVSSPHFNSFLSLVL